MTDTHAAAARRAALLADGLLEDAGSYRDAGTKYRAELRVTRDIVVELIAPGSGVFVVIPAGYLTDGYSMPGWFLSHFQPHNPKWLLPSLVHDWLYDTGIVPRHMADRILIEQMRAAGVPEWQCHVVHAAVRLGGKGGFNRPDRPKNYELSEAARDANLATVLTDCLTRKEGGVTHV